MYVFIVNPHSCCGKGERIWEKLKKLLSQKAVDYESYLTRCPGDAKEYARKLTENCCEPRVIIAVGGGGTLNEVLDGMCFGSNIALGCIPAGLGNDFARSLRLPLSPRRALKRILASRMSRLLDYGVLTYGSQAEHRRFAACAGMGLDGEVSQRAENSVLHRWLSRLHLERFGYLLLGIGELFRAKPVKGYIILDQMKKIEFNHIYFMSAHIHPYEGGFLLAPGAEGTKGRLSVCVVSHGSKKKLFSALMSAFFKRTRGLKGIRRYECREVIFHVERPLAVQVDGEFCGSSSEMEAGCIGQKIRMLM